MSSDASDKIDEVANDLDELKTTVEELENDPPSDVEPQSLQKLERALDDASAAADELEEQEE
jgi:hypothetical protein